MFKIGDKVVCVDAKGTVGIEQDKDYIIDCVQTCKCGRINLKLRNVTVTGFRGSICIHCNNRLKDSDLYSSHRFRKLDDTFTTETLERIKEEIEEEYLILR